MVARAVLAFLPVCLFLLSLVYLDSFKLMRFRTILQLMALGCIAAAVSLVINQFLEMNGLSHRLVMRFGAPAIEELLKGVCLLLFLRARRIGFLIDAAIAGFAIGTGFALIENFYYLSVLTHGQPALWIVRGFGTAVMHGGTTAILAITTAVVSERKHSDALWLVLPGLLMAFALHSVFNHFIFSPVVSTAIIVVVLPPLLVTVFSQSEQYLREWLGNNFDLDADLLRALREGEFGQSPAGQYLHSLRNHFDGPIVADMLCYLRLHSELSLRAKGVLLLRENGFKVKKDADVAAQLAEMRYLKRTIGKTGELALAPILRDPSRDLWQLQLLESSE
jgi:RsiW-degrading membrane proteinase PrsW (M82 family)